MKTLARYLSLYAAMWRNSVTREMSFKLNFVLWIVVELLWFALQLVFMSVLYSHTDSIAGWSKWEVVMLVGCANFIQQLFTAFFLTNLTDISEHIRTGKLDFMLLLPVNTRFLVSLRKVDLGSYINSACALAVMAYAAWRLDFTPTAVQVAGFAVMSLAGLTVHYSLMFLLVTTSFWTVRAQGMRLRLLQPLQHRAAAGFRLPARGLQGVLHLRPADAAGVERPGEGAAREAQLAVGDGDAGRDGGRVPRRQRTRLALVVAALHERQFLRCAVRGEIPSRSSAVFHSLAACRSRKRRNS